MTPRARVTDQTAYRNPFGKSHSEMETVVLELENLSSNITYRSPFKLVLTVQLDLTSLSLILDIENTGEYPIDFTACFHPYFRTVDITNTRIFGLAGLTYTDKVDGYQTKVLSVASGNGMSIAEEVTKYSMSIGSTEPDKYFIDRIFDDKDSAALTLNFIDYNSGDIIEISRSSSWPNWVVFNPWIDGKKGEKGPDFDDDGYKYSVCIEPAVAESPVVLKEAERWRGSMVLNLKSLGVD
jgi:D-hexose-6-phosphate mutarotase